MEPIPQTQYAQSGDISIAYQVMGNGPIDLVIVPGFVSHLEQTWEEPSLARFLQRLASFSRLILFDKRATGLSERITGIPTLEQRMDDVRVVMDAVGSQQAVLFGISEGGPMSIVFAATYPERVSSLVLYGSIAKGSWATDYPWGDKGEDNEVFLEEWRKAWGGPFGIELWAPSVANDERFRHWWAKYLRMSTSPSAVTNIVRMNMDVDIRPILPTIHIPTLILHRDGDQAVLVEHGRYLAEHIHQAKYVELSGNDHLWWVSDSESIVNEIQTFLTGERPIFEPDRILATVLFTDIVNSTRQASELGDRRWRDLLDSHNTVMKRELNRFNGRAIKSTGDGFLATFDGPARAIRCAFAIRDEMRKIGLEIRAGLHTGEIELIDDDIGGICVHIAARVAAKAGTNEVWTSRIVRDLVVGSNLTFFENGTHELKGIPGEWDLFMVD